MNTTRPSGTRTSSNPHPGNPQPAASHLAPSRAPRPTDDHRGRTSEEPGRSR